MDWKNKLIRSPEKLLMIDAFINDCCMGLKTTPDEIITGLFSPEDMKMITESKYSMILVKAHIKVWIDQGKQQFT